MKPEVAATRSSMLRCNSCHRDYPSEGVPYSCLHCGGIFEFSATLPYDPLPSDPGSSSGIERFRASFPLSAGAPFVSLGEGGTPLLEHFEDGRRIYFKAEHLNPTGSFKDRGSAVLVSELADRSIGEAVEDSSGNAGASFAAYAAKAGIRARVFVPDYASGPKRRQIEAYGAEIVRILGPRSEASQAVQRAAKKGVVYASHAYLPHGLAGMATLAFELVEQLGEAPGTLVVPVGQGSLLLGAQMGFAAMLEAGRIERAPRLVGVQARRCAPIWAVHTGGASGLDWVREGETLAEGIRILHPHRGDAVLAAVEGTGGAMIAVEEETILPGTFELARRGMFVEPTSAVVWPALHLMQDELSDPIVAVLTGSGFKQDPSFLDRSAREWRAEHPDHPGSTLEDPRQR